MYRWEYGGPLHYAVGSSEPLYCWECIARDTVDHYTM